MSAPEMLEWLKATVEGDKAVAEKLRGETWAVVLDSPGCFSYIKTSEGHLLAALDESDPPGGLLDPDEADHMARHDPCNTLARCEADLAMLNDHLTADASFNVPSVAAWAGRCRGCGESMPCSTIRILASGYRYREGCKPSWLGGQ